MANWTAEVFENEYLADGASDVHAVVTVTCSGAVEADTGGRGRGGVDHRHVGIDARAAFEDHQRAQGAQWRSMRSTTARSSR